MPIFLYHKIIGEFFKQFTHQIALRDDKCPLPCCISNKNLFYPDIAEKGFSTLNIQNTPRWIIKIKVFYNKEIAHSGLIPNALCKDILSVYYNVNSSAILNLFTALTE